MLQRILKVARSRDHSVEMGDCRDLESARTFRRPGRCLATRVILWSKQNSRIFLESNIRDSDLKVPCLLMQDTAVVLSESIIKSLPFI